jgi:hypothetical protein
MSDRTRAMILTLKALTPDHVVTRARPFLRELWEDPSFDFCAGNLGLRIVTPATNPEDSAMLAAVERHLGASAFHGRSAEYGDLLCPKIGWSWLVERSECGWSVTGDRTPKGVGRKLHAECAVSFKDLGAEGAERKPPGSEGLRNEA